jgi:hypothetical protein
LLLVLVFDCLLVGVGGVVVVGGGGGGVVEVVGSFRSS